MTTTILGAEKREESVQADSKQLHKHKVATMMPFSRTPSVQGKEAGALPVRHAMPTAQE